MNSRIDLEKITEPALLETRICDLPLSIEGTWLQGQINQLYQELSHHQILLKPRCYLADEWVTPEDEPIIGIPFFLAHPTLIRLEKKLMLEAEGESKPEFMKLLRHEAGHALSYAYRFQKRKRWQKVFGSASQQYAETYRFRPYSKSFVRHLDSFYAQYHPDEDFAETFAIWLTPESDWRKRYQNWKALEKLQFVDQLMREIRGQEPKVKRGTPYWKASTLKGRLKNYYKTKRRSQAEDYPDFHDVNLKKIFVPKSETTEAFPSAAQLIQAHRKLLLDVQFEL